MSRSYKHTPYSGDRKNKFMKRYANHVVRRNKLKGLYPDYSGYKRAMDTWAICDYKTVGKTFEQHYAQEVSWWYEWRSKYGEPFPDRKACRKEYEKWYIRK